MGRCDPARCCWERISSTECGLCCCGVEMDSGLAVPRALRWVMAARDAARQHGDASHPGLGEVHMRCKLFEADAHVHSTKGRPAIEGHVLAYVRVRER